MHRQEARPGIVAVLEEQDFGRNQLDVAAPTEPAGRELMQAPQIGSLRAERVGSLGDNATRIVRAL